MNLEISECLAVGSRVFARWNTINKHTRYFHGFITKIRKTSVEITPSGNYGARVDRIIELPRAEKRFVIIDKQSKPSEINLGSEVIVASEDGIGFSQGQVTQRFSPWYGVDVGNPRIVWKMAPDIRLLINPIYCDREWRVKQTLLACYCISFSFSVHWFSTTVEQNDITWILKFHCFADGLHGRKLKVFLPWYPACHFVYFALIDISHAKISHWSL